jgi:hypothetical protein
MMELKDYGDVPDFLENGYGVRYLSFGLALRFSRQ